MSSQYADGSFREDWKRRALAAEARAESAEAALQLARTHICRLHNIDRHKIADAIEKQLDEMMKVTSATAIMRQINAALAAVPS